MGLWFGRPADQLGLVSGVVYVCPFFQWVGKPGRPPLVRSAQNLLVASCSVLVSSSNGGQEPLVASLFLVGMRFVPSSVPYATCCFVLSAPMLGMARLNGRTRYASPSSRQLIASRQLQLVSPVWDGKTRFGSDGKRGEYQVSYAHGHPPPGMTPLN